ncbi:hypothetical protein HaLaN_30226, partial [Haematococcus lacustris]
MSTCQPPLSQPPSPTHEGKAQDGGAVAGGQCDGRAQQSKRQVPGARQHLHPEGARAGAQVFPVPTYGGLKQALHVRASGQDH